jgi:glycosyltransferase involved in cell wall biosynthesis
MLCVSREDALVAKHTGFHAPKGIFNIPNGVEPAPYIDVSEDTIQGLREDFSLPADSLVVGYFGRLTREKGTLELVEALFPLFREFPNLQALIVGPVLSTERDRVMDELKFRIVDEGVEDRIRFVGYRHDVPAVLQLCDVFCLPSWREGFPVTVLEAMMAGRAIVGTQIRGIREMIRTEEHGLLVPIRSAEALRNALQRLLSSPGLRAELGTRARQRALQLYTLSHQLNRTRRAYERVLKAKP